MTDHADQPDNVVNLNKFRKAKARAEGKGQAAENRILHGRTKGEKARDEAAKSENDKTVESHKIDGEPGPDDPDGKTPA